MKRVMRAAWSLAAAVALGLGGCGDDPASTVQQGDGGGLNDVGGGGGDAGGGGDPGGADEGGGGDGGGLPDVGPDGGLPDGGLPDEGLPDEGAPDEGLPDEGLPDGGVPDGDLPDGGVPDGGGSGLVISGATVQQACGDACEQILDGCGVIGGWDDLAACGSACMTAAAGDAAFVGNWICIAQTCSVEACGSGAPVPLDAACVSACGLIESCGVAELFEVVPGEPDFCVAMCSGQTAANPGVTAIAECIGAYLGDGACDGVGATSCTGQATLCESACGDAFTEEGDGDGLYCAADQTFTAVYPDQAACQSACEGQGTSEQSTMAALCLYLEGCDAAACQALPAAYDPGCVAACDALVALCGPSVEGITNPVACPGACTLFAAKGGGVAADAVACVEALEACPASEDEQAGAFLTCALGPVPLCVDTCAKVDACGGAFGGTVEECVAQCSFGYAQSPEVVAEVAACVDAAGADCQAVAACIPTNGE